MNDSLIEGDASSGSLRQDAVIKQLLSAMPEAVQTSFSEEQLAHLKLSVGSRHWEKHTVDLRGTFKLWKRRYYYVLLFGRNSREVSRWQQQLSGFATTLIAFAFVLFSVVTGLLVLYLIKSALGINLFKDYSLGIWSWFKEIFR